ncbi:BTP domain-containing protein [Mycena venus]|uniref:BTP domain-containing protein n=1 Tax=Mycena venus TaxID=2733690 RepID=A0A8H6TZE7_9AGAR|nr:BTP domain-containing protein [Mycena venus]
MEYASHKLLEAATHRSLHAAAFARSSTHASAVLTDLLARYIQLLASTSAKYAQHAGRTTVTTTDALEALDDLGFGLHDLIDYVPEARELSRYALYSARRVEELNEFKTQLGRNVRDDAFPLTYAPYDAEDEEMGLDEDEEDDEMEVEPPQKRQRTLDWDGHIPSFLPPFPTVTDVPDSPRAESPQPSMPPPPPSAGGAALPVPQLQLTATSTSAADYVLQVPYEASTLAEVSQWHLPGPPPRPPPPTQTPSGTTGFTLNPELALYKAFHHILKNPTREPAPANPARHRVAMGLLTLTASVPRWELPDTMYAGSAPAPPRAWPIVPTFAVPTPLANGASAETPQTTRRFPPTHRTVAAPDRIAPLVGAQGSRLPELARRVLPPSVYARVTKLAHPPPLTRGQKLLKYGPGVPAPWNAPERRSGDADGEGGGGEGSRCRKDSGCARVCYLGVRDEGL